MKERPILFNGPMVRALLDGSKTQTRRLVNPAPEMVTDIGMKPWSGDPAALMNLLTQAGRRCPYGQPGDRLWVRESWHQRGKWRLPAFPEADWDDAYWAGTTDVLYAADAARPERGWRGRPSIHMPRWASRILLEITGVRVERLQDISEADARAEGVTIEDRHMRGYCAGEFLPPSIRAYSDLWKSINGGGSWDANPWVWAVEFQRVGP
jgi:hypothetical protein